MTCKCIGVTDVEESRFFIEGVLEGVRCFGRDDDLILERVRRSVDHRKSTKRGRVLGQVGKRITSPTFASITPPSLAWKRIVPFVT